MKKILTVSLVAIMAATAANAEIASTKYVTDRTGTTANLTTTAKELTGAVNELKTTLDLVAGDSTSSVGDRINAAKQELTTEIGEVEDKADANAAAIAAADLAQVGADGSYIKLVSQADGKVSATSAAFKDSIAIDNETSTNAPTAKAVFDHVKTEMSALNTGISTANTKITALEGRADTLESEVDAINNDTTGILAQAKADATSKADQALTDAKAYAEQQDAAQTTTITNAYTAADSALETSLKAYADAEDKKIEDQIGTVEQGKTVVQMITEAKEAASGDAGEVASDLAEYKTDNDAAVAAAQAAADAAQDEVDALEGVVATQKTDLQTAISNGDAATLASAKEDATTKANAAQAAAEATAAADATTKANAALAEAKSYADTAEADAKTYGDNTFQVKSSALSVGAANGAWTDLTAATGYSTTGTHSLVLKNGVIQWELVDYGEDKE